MNSHSIDWVRLRAIETLDQDTYANFVKPCEILFAGREDIELAISLFRNVYHISEEGGGIPSGISSDDFLALLRITSEKVSKPYQPDVALNYVALQIEAYISSAYILALASEVGWNSEDIWSGINESSEKIQRSVPILQSIDSSLYSSITEYFEEVPEDVSVRKTTASIFNLAGLMFIRNGKLLEDEGQLTESLEFYSKGWACMDLTYYYIQQWQSDLLPRDSIIDIPIGHSEMTDSEVEDFEDAVRLRDQLWGDQFLKISKANPQDVVNVFELIREKDGPDWNWPAVLQVCNANQQIILRGDLFYEQNQQCDFFADATGESRQWDEYWAHVEGWIKARMEPSELRNMMREEKEDRSKRVIKQFFIRGNLWDFLTERSQNSLIDAVGAWSSSSGRSESMYQDVKIAVEEIIYRWFWIPCCDFIDNMLLDSPRSLQMQTLRKEIQIGRNPTLSHFTRMLKTRAFMDFIEGSKLSIDDSNFLKSEELYKDLNSLNGLRNKAEHDFSYSGENNQKLIDRFFGIGVQGIIPTLVKIGARLNQN